jgi:hypothetical protein
MNFRRAPVFGLFFGGIFSVTGIVIFLQLLVWGSSYWCCRSRPVSRFSDPFSRSVCMR